MYRQGDVLIEAVEDWPETGTVVPPRDGRIILAEGEATGHHHSLPECDVESALADDGGALFLRLIRDSTLEHQEHSAIRLRAGIYKVTRQREYSPTGTRRVRD